MKKWKILEKKLALDNKWFKVRSDRVLLPNGKILDEYLTWQNRDVAAVVPITPDGRFVMVKQYRHGNSEITLEFPVGYIEEKESSKNTAIRELQEETGYIGKKLISLGKLINNASKETGNIFLYLAVGVEKGKKIAGDPNEQIEVVLLTKRQLIKVILSGEVRVTFSVAATFLTLLKLGKFGKG